MTLAEQLNAFLLSLLTGLMSGFAYDLYRVLREMLRLKKAGTFIGDLLFWLFLLVVVFGLLLVGNDGEVRFYVFLGLALGAGIHLIFFSSAARRFIYRSTYLFLRTIQIIAAGAVAFFRILIFPFRVIFFLVVWPAALGGRALCLAGRRVGRVGKGVFGPYVHRFSGGLHSLWLRLSNRWRPRR
ncbi:spore cortex biosynthesis protein YabQ [Desulfofundulus thermosubterraneus]|uniref:Spore cortex biosynthesis protein YabQ n=1 Tax=Desulfofundulus thermosubterraneus DSM 16057 TaxID=1121432 RepID=A0A1M6DVL4_9FIRM|nr:spore cortex biosynthesis protein YabQ [Desulfofundulus thermosubterraneus]SHI77215.1 spore cortex biosynthesis protein YabQ [Desulfofundulus thermosubterraneus DSM 16057]